MMKHRMEEFAPSIDILTEDDNVVVKAELPGIKKEDIDVDLTEDTITISGEKKKEEKVEKRTITVLSVPMALSNAHSASPWRSRLTRHLQNSRMACWK